MTTIETTEQAETLPVGTVLRLTSGQVYARIDTADDGADWQTIGDTYCWGAAEMLNEHPGPATVLHNPTQPAPAGVTDREALALAAAAPRFWPRVQVGSKNECWPWTGTTLEFGHGKWDGPLGSTTAHRYAWSMANARVPEQGIVVRHRCDNPICCNPDHLELGTQAENVHDMITRGRASFTETSCRKGHDRSPENTLTKADGSRRCKTCDRDQQAVRRAKYQPMTCIFCEHQANVYNLRRHISNVHGQDISATEIRARADELEREDKR